MLVFHSFFLFKASNWWNSIPSSLTIDKNFHAFCKDYYELCVFVVYGID